MKVKIDRMVETMKGMTLVALHYLVKRIAPPFTPHVMEYPLPPNFKMLQLETLNATKDLLHHLENYKTLIHLQAVPNEIMCKVFPTTLKGSTKVWFKKLKPSSMDSFAELSKLFGNHII